MALSLNNSPRETFLASRKTNLQMFRDSTSHNNRVVAFLGNHRQVDWAHSDNSSSPQVYLEEIKLQECNNKTSAALEANNNHRLRVSSHRTN